MRIIKTVVCMLICFVMVVNVVAADSYGPTAINYEDKNMTVIFDRTQISDEDACRRIADRLVYGVNENDIAKISFCWLFGHDITTTTVMTITHNVRTTSPRCLKEIHDVQVCSKCDYIKDEVTSAVYIVCH